MSLQAIEVERVVSRLAGFSRYESRDEGRVETQVFLSTPAGRLFATVIEPLGERKSVALMFCHSFAWEQYELYPLELSAARAAASAGFASMTFQSRGYNDSGGDFHDVTFSTHVRDAVAAASELRKRTNAESVVPIGASFGAAVALKVAVDTGAPGAVMWNPSEPGAFLDGMIRASTVAGILDEDGQGGESGPRGRGFQELKAALDAGETLDLFGFPVSPGFYREAQATKLWAGDSPLEGTPSKALVLVANPAGKRAAERVSKFLSENGCAVRVEQADGPGRREFAASIPRGGHLATHAVLFDDIVGKTIAWAKETW